MSMENLLPPFPVDDATLLALEHALGAALYYDEEGDLAILGADYTVPGLLDFLSGYDPTKVEVLMDGIVPGIDEPEVVEYIGGPLYTRDCVIRALIAEIRRLRSI